MSAHKTNILLVFFFLFMSIPLFSANYYPDRDTLPPAPSSPDTLNGPEEVCVGEIGYYTADFPMGCFNVWYVDDSLQGSDSAVLEVVWNNPGNHVVKAYCDDTTNLIGLLDVTVTPFPDVFLGNDTTLQEGQTLLLDAANEGSTYLWSTGDTTQTLLVSETGLYSVLVTNDCGEDSDTIFVDILTSIPGNSKQPVNISVSTNTLAFSHFTRNETVTVYSLSGKIIYNGNIKKSIFLKGRQVVLIILREDNNLIKHKIYIP